MALARHRGQRAGSSVPALAAAKTEEHAATQGERRATPHRATASENNRPGGIGHIHQTIYVLSGIPAGLANHGSTPAGKWWPLSRLGNISKDGQAMIKDDRTHRGIGAFRPLFQQF